MTPKWHHLLLLGGVSLLFLSALMFQPGNSQKVILISLDGGMNSLLQEYMGDFAKSEGFSRIKKEGQLATEGMTVSLPSLTATSHISLITGKPPAEHGIVSNTFHNVLTPMTESQNGFSAPIDPRAKTLWEVARHSGKRVGVISYPSLDNTNDRRRADWSVNFSKSVGKSTKQMFTLSDFSSYENPLPPDVEIGDAPPLTLKFYIEETPPPAIASHPHPDKEERSLDSAKHEIILVALDTSRDNQKNYDTLYFDSDPNLSNGFLSSVTQSLPWGKIAIQDRGVLKGSWAKVTGITPSLSRVELYIGALYKTEAFPASFQRVIDEEIGFWPGPPDQTFLDQGLTDEDMLQQAVRLSEYLHSVTLLGAKTQKWDLILTYQPILDELEHQFYLVDPRQKDYSKAKSERWLSLIRRGYLQTNSVIGGLMAVHPKSNLIVVSDHGMSPIHRVYYPNRVLEMRGYIESKDPDNPDPAAKTYYAKAFSSGGLSHVYINVEGRGPDGIVPKEQFQTIQKEIVAIFEKEEAIASVYTRDQLHAVSLDHPNSGDIVLVAHPGYHLNNALGNGEVLEPAPFYGQHGYDPGHPSMKALFGSWGPDIPRKDIKAISYRDVFVIAKDLLGL